MQPALEDTKTAEVECLDSGEGKLSGDSFLPLFSRMIWFNYCNFITDAEKTIHQV